MTKKHKFPINFPEDTLQEMRRLVSYAQRNHDILPQDEQTLSAFAVSAIKRRLSELRHEKQLNFSEQPVMLRPGRPPNLAHTS